MIVVANSPKEWQALAGFLRHYAGVHPSADLQLIGWVSDKELVAVVGFNSFVGKVAQIHIAYAPSWHFTPRQFAHEAFRYAFVTAQREMLIGVVNSKNDKAMRWDQHLGFRELYRIPGMHDDGGDVVMLGMNKTECRYLGAPTESMAVAEAGSA